MLPTGRRAARRLGLRFQGRMPVPPPFAWSYVVRQRSLSTSGCVASCDYPAHKDGTDHRAPSTSTRRSLTTRSSTETLSRYPPAQGIEEMRGPHGVYHTEYKRSLADPEAFWASQADKLHWFAKPTTVLKQHPTQPLLYQWFPDGLFNTCYNCLDVHVQQGRGAQDALIYDSPVTGVKERYTYAALLDHVARFAGVLRDDLGVQAGDVVLIYMPMIPEAAIAMLACARIGATQSVVFGGFAAHELAKRIQDCQPKVVVSASAGQEPTRVVPYKPLLDEARRLAQDHHEVESCVIVQRPHVLTCELGPTDKDYLQLMAQSTPADAVPLPGNHCHSVLYTSGTTGIPKGVVRSTADWAVALKYSMSAFYDTQPGETMWAASDIGWVVGSAYIVFAPLLQGCTTILYEGKPVGTPDAGAMWRVVQDYHVKTLFVAPTALRAIKQADPNAKLVHQYDMSSLRALFLAGEHSDPDTLNYCKETLAKYGSPVNEAIDHWWQTELGHPAVGNAIGLGRRKMRPGACSGPAPGFDVRIVNDDGVQVPANTLGNMVLKIPMPPGTLPTLYKNDQAYIDSYLTKYPGFYDTGDAAFVDDDGYIHVMGRTDDLIITAGHRLSTGGLEEVLQAHAEVAECAVVKVKDELKGEVPVGFVVLNKGSTMEKEQIKLEVIQSVREQVGPVASFKKVAIVNALPKTRSGKILRGTMSSIANGEPYSITPTIEDAAVLTYLEPIIQELVRGD